MNELTPIAKELVRAGRAASRPNPADRERISHALQARIDISGAPNAPTPPTQSLSLLGKGWLGWTGIGIAALCGLGAVVLIVMSSSAPVAMVMPRIEQSVPAQLAPTPADAVVVSSAEPAEEVTKNEAPSRSPSPMASARSSDRLADEVAILSRAEADLHRGQASSALRSLDEHQRKFPSGALSLERRAARVRALCALGRSNEATAELKRLTRSAPGSPLERRAREACGTRVN
ncbi:MAG TPA: hypothetical protein VFQ61_18545 [Polyangiaceae bacterium]|nr:hypothetical protein [Polyangiaceae bacterium]